MIKQKFYRSFAAAALLAIACFAVATPAQARPGFRGGGWGYRGGWGNRPFGYGVGYGSYGYAYRPFGNAYRPYGYYSGWGLGPRTYVGAPMLYNRGFYGGYGYYGYPGYGYAYPYGGSYFGTTYVAPGYWW